MLAGTKIWLRTQIELANFDNGEDHSSKGKDWRNESPDSSQALRVDPEQQEAAAHKQHERDGDVDEYSKRRFLSSPTVTNASDGDHAVEDQIEPADVPNQKNRRLTDLELSGGPQPLNRAKRATGAETRPLERGVRRHATSEGQQPDHAAR